MNLTKRTDLRLILAFAVAALGLFAGSPPALPQQTKPFAEPESAPTIASVMEVQLRIVESQLIPAAEAMPADRYSFAPISGEYKEVRTFALQLKHVATANFVFYSAILGQDPPLGATLSGTTNGPEDIKTKEQVLKYLRDSFALGHKAFATLTAENVVTPLVRPPIPFMNTRLAMASFSCTHASDHYGQIVEYLRMNGIVPPTSKGQPPANPGGR
jgi:DinB family protein